MATILMVDRAYRSFSRVRPREDADVDRFVDGLTRGNVDQVKTVLASVVLALAAYQVLLMAVGYGKLKVPFLKARAASFSHRAVGDAIVAVTVLVAFMCFTYFGVGDGIEHARGEESGRATVHVVAASLLLATIGLKVVVIRWWRRLDRFLPALGLSVFTLFGITWVTSAGDYLWGG
jgi:Family of unknown function (DUF6529)